MSKELEKFNDILRWSGISVDTRLNEQFKNDCRVVRKALTVPTEEELLDALSKHYDRNKIVYEENRFYVVVNERLSYAIVEKIEDKVSIHAVWLPPHIITMIGRFYEAQVEKDYEEE